MFNHWVAFIATRQGTCLCGVCLATGWWVTSSDAMLWAVSILSVFCGDTSALRGSCYSYLSDKCNYKLPFSPPTRCFSLIRLESCWLGSLGGDSLQLLVLFAIWPTAETWLSLDSSFLSSFCVSSLTDNHFSLPISLQSQLPFKSLLHTTFPVTATTTGFKFYSFLPSDWSLDAKPIFHHHFQTALLLCMHVTESENSWDWKRPLEII